jgi:hypothetical protein
MVALAACCEPFRVLIAIPALVWHMWPLLHWSRAGDGFFSSFGAALSAEKPCGLFLLLWFVSCVWLWRKARRTSRQSLEDRFVNLEEALTELWARQWQRREIAIVSSVILLESFFLAFLTRFLAFAERPGKEAFAPLCQLFGLAVLLVPGKAQLHSVGRVRLRRKSLIGIFLILLPCCVLPAIGFDDPGGMVGGLALFLPFLFVVLLGDHRPLAKWWAGAFIVVFVAGILLAFFPGWAKHWPRVYTRVTLAEHTSKWAQDQWLTQQAYGKTEIRLHSSLRLAMSTAGRICA